MDVITQELLQSPKTEKETKIALLRQVISSNQQANVSDSAEVMKLFSQALSVPQADADILMMKAAYMSLKKMPRLKSTVFMNKL